MLGAAKAAVYASFGSPIAEKRCRGNIQYGHTLQSSRSDLPVQGPRAERARLRRSVRLTLHAENRAGLYRTTPSNRFARSDSGTPGGGGHLHRRVRFAARADLQQPVLVRRFEAADSQHVSLADESSGQDRALRKLSRAAGTASRGCPGASHGGKLAPFRLARFRTSVLERWTASLSPPLARRPTKYSVPPRILM
jgi:hypothetical protein